MVHVVVINRKCGPRRNVIFERITEERRRRRRRGGGGGRGGEGGEDDDNDARRGVVKNITFPGVTNNRTFWSFSDCARLSFW